MPTLPARTITSATGAPDSEAMPLRTPNTRLSCSGLFTSQSFCGARRIRAPLAPPRISEPRKVEALAQAVSTISCRVNPLSKIRDLTASTS